MSKTQTNKITIINKVVRYIFLLWEGFKAHLVQIYKKFEKEKTAIKKLYKFKQTASAIVYMTKF